MSLNGRLFWNFRAWVEWLVPNCITPSPASAFTPPFSLLPCDCADGPLFLDLRILYLVERLSLSLCPLPLTPFSSGKAGKVQCRGITLSLVPACRCVLSSHPAPLPYSRRFRDRRTHPIPSARWTFFSITQPINNPLIPLSVQTSRYERSGTSLSTSSAPADPSFPRCRLDTALGELFSPSLSSAS